MLLSSDGHRLVESAVDGADCGSSGRLKRKPPPGAMQMCIRDSVHVHHAAALGNRDDRGIGEHAHARRGPMAHARLARGQGWIGVEVKVRAEDLVEPPVDHDGAVHLGQLEQTVAGEGDVQRKTIVAGGEHGLGVAHADESADMAGDDHVECGAQRLPGGGEAHGLLHACLLYTSRCV